MKTQPPIDRMVEQNALAAALCAYKRNAGKPKDRAMLAAIRAAKREFNRPLGCGTIPPGRG